MITIDLDKGGKKNSGNPLLKNANAAQEREKVSNPDWLPINLIPRVANSLAANKINNMIIGLRPLAGQFRARLLRTEECPVS
jgi:hypothetical protein